MAGTGVVVLAITYSALRFRGKSGERFSLLNHFISELGEWGVSRGAWAFNGGLVLAGLLFLPFAVHLGIVLGSVLGWVGASFAMAASLGVAAVGVFPMNTLKRHVPAAATFFYGGLVTVLAIGLAALTQPAERVIVPRIASLLSLLAAFAFGSFVALPRITMPELDLNKLLDTRDISERPRFWILPFLEWLVFFTTISWLLGMAFLVLRQ